MSNVISQAFFIQDNLRENFWKNVAFANILQLMNRELFRENSCPVSIITVGTNDPIIVFISLIIIKLLNIMMVRDNGCFGVRGCFGSGGSKLINTKI